MTEDDIHSEPTPLAEPPAESEKSLLNRLRRFLPYAVGVGAFILGLVIFAPIEAYAYLALRQLSATGVRVDVEELKLSPFGRFSAESIKIPLGGEQDKQHSFQIAELTGRIALLDALMSDKFDATADATIISFAKGDFKLKIDTLEIISKLEQSKSGGTHKTMSGSVSLQGESAQATYRENKFLKEDIVLPFLKIILKLRAQQNNFQIETCEAIGRLINAQVKGTFSVGQQTDLNLNIILKPTEEFYQKYQDKDPKTLLKFAGVLQDDGRIEINVRGPLAQLVIETVKAVPAQPSASAVPTPPPAK
ncbi:MAG: type II secretion system protein GspN [Spirochaetes bacterium]|nr:type II secretion system protein GspN [Spirochaetota bacterium]